MMVAVMIPSSIAVWNFMPDSLAVAAEVDSPDELRWDFERVDIAKASGDRDAAVLARKASENTTSELPDRPRRERVKLPEPFSLAKTISAPVVAVATEITQAQIDTLHRDAQVKFAEAARHRDAGDNVNWALSYLDVLEQFPNATESKLAYQELAKISEMAVRGDITPTEFLDFGRQLPTWENANTTLTKYVILGYYFSYAEGAREMGFTDVAKANYQKLYDYSMQFIDEHPNDSIVVYAYAHWLDAVRHMDIRMEYLDELRARVKVEDDTLSSMMARAMLIKNYAELGDMTRAKIHIRYLLRDVNYDHIDRLLADDLVLDGVKEHVLHHLGKAHLGKGNHDEARQTFERIRDNYLPASNATDNAAYYLAEIKMRNPDLAPYDHILALQGYLDRHPDGNNVGNVLRKMANVYIQNDDYLNGLDILDEVQVRTTSDRMKSRASEQADFILRNMAGEIERQEEERLAQIQLAQACGPIALHHLLQLHGIESNLETLILSAGVTDAGTSMADLIRVSGEKGLALKGVGFASLEDAQYPFIAFVNDDHFVLVTERENGELLVRDRMSPPELRSVASFASEWNGYALVSTQEFQLANELPPETLNSAIGGDGSPVIDCITDDCREDNISLTPSSGFMMNDGDGDGNYGSVSSGILGGDDPIGDVTPCVGCGTPDLSTFDIDFNYRFGPRGGGSYGSYGRYFGLRSITRGHMSRINAATGALEIAANDIAISTVGGLTLEFGRVYSADRGHDRIAGTDPDSQSDFGMIWTHNYNRYVLEIEDAGTNDGPEVIKVFGNTGWGVDFERTGGTWMGFQFYTQDGSPIVDGESFVYRNDTTGDYGLKKADGSEVQYFNPDTFSDERGRIKAITSKGYLGVAVTFVYNGDELTRVNTPSTDNRYIDIEYCTTTGGGCYPGMIKAVYLVDGLNGDIRKVEYEYKTMTDDTYPNEPKTRYFLEHVIEDGDTANKISYNYEKYLVVIDSFETIEVTLHFFMGSGLGNSNSGVINSGARTYAPTSVYPGGDPGHRYIYAEMFSLSSITNKNGESEYYDYAFQGTSQYAAPQFDLTHTTPDGNYTESAYSSINYELVVKEFEEFETDPLTKTQFQSGGTHTRRKSHFEDPLQTTPSTTWEYEYNTTNDELEDIIGPESATPLMHLDYDSEKRVSAITVGATTASGGPTWTLNYEAGTAGPTKMVDPEGVPIKFEYDSTTNRPTKIIAPHMKNAPAPNDGILFDFESSTGNVTKVTDEFGESWTVEYNSRGQVTKATDPIGAVAVPPYSSEWEYNWKGQLTKTITPLTATDDAVVEYEYATTNCATCGGKGRLTKIKRFTDATNFLAVSMEYNVSGQATKIIYPDGKSTSYEYDNLSRLTMIDPLSDGLEKTTYVYNDLGEVKSITGPDGKTYDYNYDYLGQLKDVVDPVTSDQLIEYFYNSLGKVTKVQDLEDNVWEYFYDDKNRLTKTKDPDSGGANNYVRYFYDDGFRVTKTAGGDTGTTEIDPVQYFYETSGTDPRGLLSKVSYTNTPPGGSATTVNGFYNYSPEGRFTKVTDWVGGSGNEYFYDELGRVTSVADYDDVSGSSTVDYEFDYAGRVTQVTDLHDNVTSYSYTNLNQLDTMTAPGSKTWDYDYDSFGRSTKVTYPNNMSTVAAYDATDGAVTKISHKADGGAVKQSFEYTYNDVYDIDKIVHEDGSQWDYTYDDKYRLSTATRSNGAILSATIQADYAFTYDDADNLITKVAPFKDDFNDGVVAGNGWTANGTWTATDGIAQNDIHATSWSRLSVANTDADYELRFRYRKDDSTTGGYLRVRGRETGSTRFEARFYPGDARILQWDGTSWTTPDQNTAEDTDDDVWYSVRMVYDSGSLKVYRAEDGQVEKEILSTTGQSVTTTVRTYFDIPPNAQFSIDNVQILSDNLSTTTTYAYNDANELTTMTDYNGTTTYTYDDLGRTISKTRGSNTATYTWAPGDFLESVESTFPDEGDVAYTYTAGGGRVERHDTTNSDYTWYNGNSDEKFAWSGPGEGDLKRSYYGNADILGDDAAATPTRYYMTDHLGSTRSVWDETGNEVASFEYTPYGESFTESGPEDITVRFTGHDWDETAQLYYAPFRYYSPGTARWMKPDPLGMVDGPNMYAYVGMNPINYTDPLGLNIGDVAPGGFPVGSPGIDPQNLLDQISPHINMENLQKLLDYAGWIPGIGNVADIGSLLLALYNGDWTGAGIAAVAAIPIVGNLLKKLLQNLRKLRKGADKLGDGLKVSKAPTPRKPGRGPAYDNWKKNHAGTGDADLVDDFFKNGNISPDLNPKALEAYKDLAQAQIDEFPKNLRIQQVQGNRIRAIEELLKDFY
jgi:RHS repeat-associated protein